MAGDKQEKQRIVRRWRAKNTTAIGSYDVEKTTSKKRPHLASVIA